MGCNYLSDADIQDFLDRSELKRPANIAEHLKVCSVCQEKIEQYRKVYSVLEQDPGYGLPKDFARSIMSRLQLEGLGGTGFGFWEVALSVFGVLITIGATIYFIDMSPFVRSIVRLVLPAIDSTASLRIYWTELTALFNGYLPLAFFGLLALLCVAAIDRVILQHRYREASV